MAALRSPVCTDDRCEHATFFPDLRLNYAENLLRIDSVADRDRPALAAYHADRPIERLSRGELRARVLAVAEQLRGLGLTPGDRVAAVTRNNVEAVVGGLASAPPSRARLRRWWAPAILSRFEPLSPKVLLANLAAEGEAYSAALSQRIGEVARELPSLNAIVALDDGPRAQRARGARRTARER
jgi:acetoacetyl-CoA synthetase